MKLSEKIYICLTIVFCILIVVGNLTYQKFIFLGEIFHHRFEISAGAVLYPLTFVITDLIAEFYGREKARFSIFLSLVSSITVVLIISLQDYLPATSWSKLDDVTFHNIFGFYVVSFFASLTAMFISQNIDASIYLALKKITKNRYIPFRNIFSSGLGLLVDSCIVVSIMSYFGAIPLDNTKYIIFNSYIWKISLTIAISPLFYICVRLLSRFYIRNNNSVN
jgi:uncharacterized integral membrane protein (TIGR00697 family)